MIITELLKKYNNSSFELSMMDAGYYSPNLMKKFSKKDEEDTKEAQKGKTDASLLKTSLDRKMMKIRVRPWKDLLKEEVTDLFQAVEKTQATNRKYSAKDPNSHVICH